MWVNRFYCVYEILQFSICCFHQKWINRLNWIHMCNGLIPHWRVYTVIKSHQMQCQVVVHPPNFTKRLWVQRLQTAHGHWGFCVMKEIQFQSADRTMLPIGCDPITVRYKELQYLSLDWSQLSINIEIIQLSILSIQWKIEWKQRNYAI